MVTEAASLLSGADRVGRAQRPQKPAATEQRKSGDPLGFFTEYAGHMERSLLRIYSLEGFDRDYNFELQRALETYTLRERMKGLADESGPEILGRIGGELETAAAKGALEVPFALDTRSVAAKVIPELNGGQPRLTGARATVEFFR